MASLPATESDYDFVLKPSEDFFCPVTLDFLREPHQMLCCGNHLSRDAVTRLQGQACPVCKEPNLNTVPDKFFKRKANELKVHCPNKSLGCKWVGELGSLDRHLRQSSVEGECQFVTIDCPCGNQHCRYQLIDENCPLQVIECEFNYAGCEVKCQRQHMQTHLDENVKVHLNKVSHKLQSTTEQQQEQRSIIEQLQKQIAALMSAIRVALDTQKPLALVFVPPPDMVMTDFHECRPGTDDQWHSPRFYTHIGGYKMYLVVMVDLETNYPEGTYVFIFVELTQGEYDDQLKWPFRGDITIQLLNQRRDEGHWERTAHFDDAASDEWARRMVPRQRDKYWCITFPKFITFSELNTKDKEYVKNDCLKFRVTKAVIKSI